MNAKKMITKSVTKLLLVAVLAAFAGLTLPGRVAADHVIGVPHAVDIRMSRLDRFGQYLAALELSEQGRSVPTRAEPLTVRMHRMDRFGQYLAALDLEAQQREASLAFETVGFEAHSGIRFEQYQWALTQ